MKNTNSIRRTLALMTAAISVVTLTGCGGKATKGSTLEVSFDHAYSSKPVELENYEVNRLTPVGNNVFMTCYDENWIPSVMRYNIETGEMSDAGFAFMEQNNELQSFEPMGIFSTDDGGVQVLYMDYVLNEETWECEETTYYLETYDSSMKLLDTKDISENYPEDAQFYNYQKDGSGNIYAFTSAEDGTQSVAMFDADFTPVTTIDIDAEWLDSLFCTPDGSVYVTGYSTSGEMLVGKINPETKSMEALDFENMPPYYNGVIGGAGEYDLFLYDAMYLYGIKTEEKTCEEVVNWINSDFMGNYINSVVALPDGRFLASQYNTDFEGSSLWIMEKRSEEELKNMELISLAALYSSSDLTEAVCHFNRSNDKCRIVMKCYEEDMDYESETAYEDCVAQFKTDMTSGKVADIICMDNLPFESYANKGMFLDLYELMEQDENFNKDDYFANYFKSLEYNDMLQRIGFSFSVKSMAAKSEYVGTESGLSPAEYLELMKSFPDDIEPFHDMTKMNALYTLGISNLGSFVDTKNAVCHFDSPEFVELLEFCATYPNESETDYSSDDWWIEYETAHRNDKVVFKEVYLASPSEYHILKQGTFGTDDVTMVGYPTVDENDCGSAFASNFTLSVSRQTKYRDEVWEFLSYMLSEDYQKGLDWNFPIHKGAYKAMTDKAVNTKDEYGDMHYIGDEEINIGYPTQQEMDELTAYIEGITKNAAYDNSVVEIVDEECDIYFSGDQSAEETAKMIQSRVSLYLSEQS